MKSCIIGGITHDIFLQYDTSHLSVSFDEEQGRSFILFPKGGKIEVSAITKAFGGGASNVATSFARLGQDVAIVSLCGTDLYDEARNQLQHDGVDVAFLQKTDAYQTGFSCIIPTKDGDRIVFSYAGANGYLERKHIPFTVCQEYDFVYVAPLHQHAQQLLPDLVKFTREHAILTTVNPSRAQLTSGFEIFSKALAQIDILILNSSEAQELMIALLDSYPDMISDLAALKRQAVASAPQLIHAFCVYQDQRYTLLEFALLMQDRGPRTIVVTNGKEGVYVIADMSIYFHQSKAVPVLCSLGAGDAFGSTFAAYILSDHSIQEALVAGILNASHVITHYGAQEGLAQADVLASQVAAVGDAGIQRFFWQ